MKFTILKIKGNSMHPTLESGDFVLVWHSKWLFNRNKFFKKGAITKFVANRVPWPAGLQIAAIGLKVGDVVAVNHEQYGLIIKRVEKISNTPQSAKVSARNKQLSLVQFRLRGDNVIESVTEDDMGWVDAKSLIGKVVYIVKG